MSATGRAAVASVTTTAPLEPNTVYCVSTSTPIELVIAQPSAHSALSAGAQRYPARRARIDVLAEHPGADGDDEERRERADQGRVGDAVVGRAREEDGEVEAEEHAGQDA